LFFHNWGSVRGRATADNPTQRSQHPFCKLVSTVPAAIKLRAFEEPFQKTVDYFHRVASCGDHLHLTFITDEILICTLDSHQYSISDRGFSSGWSQKPVMAVSEFPFF